MNQPETYGVTEAAHILGLSRATLLRYVDAKKVPAIRLAGKVLVPRAYIDKLFEDAGFPREAASVAG